MTQSSQSRIDLLNKWEPIIESQSHIDNKPLDSTIDFPNLLPMAKKITAKTIGVDLVSVQPIGMSQEELDRMNAEIKAENREGKIESILENKEYEEKTIEDHPDYKGLPTGKLFYMDYKYGHKK